MRRSVWLVAGAFVLAGFLAVSAASAQIYEQKYVVEAVIVPADEDLPLIATSEVWETLVYRDAIRHHTVVRVFGEALHFDFQGENYFALKRTVSGSSAGFFDPLRECLGIQHLSDYATARKLTEPCNISLRTPMIVRVGDRGQLERLTRSGPGQPYDDFTISFTVSPTVQSPELNLVERFPWIADLESYEPSLYPVNIPEEGSFVPEKHYEKDFVVQK